jgi:hypothetical protein
MMGNKLNLLNKKFGKLTVIGISKIRRSGNHVYFTCKCECGNNSNVRGTLLNRGKTIQCQDCANKSLHANNKTHGMFGTSTYHVWIGMKERCCNPQNCNYHNYGLRGITVCKKWKASFQEFLKDMGVKPYGLSLERINNNKGYSPANCKWATTKEQSYNRRTNVYIEHNGDKMILIDWARRLNTGATSIKQMLRRGKSFQEVIDFYTLKKDAARIRKQLS